MATSSPKIKIVLAAPFFGNLLLREWLEADDMAVEWPSEPTTEDDWRKQMYKDVATSEPQVVILSPAHSETMSTCLALLDFRPDLLVLAVPLERSKGEAVAIAYRKAPVVEEVRVDRLLSFIRAACREDGNPTGDEAP